MDKVVEPLEKGTLAKRFGQNDVGNLEKRT